MHFRQIYCNSLRIKKTQMLLNNNLYKIKHIHYTDFGSAWFYGGDSQTQLVLPEFDLGRLYMNWMLFFTVATFFVTTISTIYVVLSLYKKDKE